METDRLLEELIKTFQVTTNDITINTTIENVEFSFDTALTFGLILNELMTNSIKHASNHRNQLHIFIDFYEKDDNYVLSFIDNGDGFEMEQLETNHSGLGYELIHEFVNKLENATMKFTSNNGVSVMITCVIKDINEQ